MIKADTTPANPSKRAQLEPIFMFAAEGFVDEEGLEVDEEGLEVDEEGLEVDEEGLEVDEEGLEVDEEGLEVDEVELPIPLAVLDGKVPVETLELANG
jgi:hypothetical protein